MAQSQNPMTRGTSGMPTAFGSWNEWMRRSMFPSFFERALTMGGIAPVDVCERDNDFVVRMACPGCRPQDIDVTVENDTVRIRGKFPSFEHEEHPAEHAAQPAAQAGAQSGTQSSGTQSSSQQGTRHEGCLIRELPTGRFERDITLPTAVNAQQAHASFDNGLLTLTLPKSAAAQGHKVQISAGAGQGAGTGMGTR
ncbi:MAG TPA: Hsp20/alpha crystallin family protein [Chloroflexota bacterium]|nr:Hsp20/alpha crystallin family protein [Chloroflexota bacterium]